MAMVHSGGARVASAVLLLGGGWVKVKVASGVGVRVGVEEYRVVRVRWNVGVRLGVGEGHVVGVGVFVGRHDAVIASEGVGLGVGERVGSGEGVAVALTVGIGLAVPVPVSVVVRVLPTDWLALDDAVAETVTV